MTERASILVLCLMLLVACGMCAGKEAVVRLTVLNEFGAPVPQARVLLFFRGPSEAEDEVLDLQANAEGIIEHRGWSKGEYLDGILVISKTPGYYESQLKHPVDLHDRAFDLTLMMRQVDKPIPMYARKVELELPEQRAEIGFDFEKGDWVKPHGNGEVADCTFIGEKHYQDRKNHEASVVMSFPTEQSGLLLDKVPQSKAAQLSNFKSCRVAPDGEYEHTKKFIRIRKGDSRDGSTEEANYMFRSRVVLGEDGKIESCHYGKLIDAVNVARRSGYPDGNPIVSFTYYFNPTPNDRNLEFDPNQNLFENLKQSEGVWAP